MSIDHPTSPRRNLVLTLHIAAAAGVLGAGSGAGHARDCRPQWRRSGDHLSAAYIVGASLVAPLALAALMTGIALALDNAMAPVQISVVTIELALTTSSSGMLLFLLIPSSAWRRRPPLDRRRRQLLPGSGCLLIGPAIASVSLLVAVTLAVSN